MKHISWFFALSLCLGACGEDSPNDTNNATSGSATNVVADVSDGATDTGTMPEDTTSGPEDGGEAPLPDPPATPDEPECNPIAKTGCEEGEKCIYGTTGAKLCEPAGETPGGAACQSTAECAEGMCMSLNDTGSYCYTFCKTIGHCPNNAPCLELSDEPYKVCKIDDLYDTCNILTQDCEGGKGCYSVAGESQPVCLPAGTEPAGGVCEGPSDCSPGHHCVNFRCYALCDKNDPDACGLFGKCSSEVAFGVGYCDEQQD